MGVTHGSYIYPQLPWLAKRIFDLSKDKGGFIPFGTDYQLCLQWKCLHLTRVMESTKSHLNRIELNKPFR